MTDDLISRQAAIDLLIKWSGGYDYIETETASAIKAFQDLPSAQPLSAWGGNPLNIDLLSAQPEIVRCRECKWWELTPDNTKLPDWHRCRRYGTIHTRVEDFCSRGERNG